MDFDATDLPIVDLTIANIGASLARDIKIEFDPPLQRTFDEGRDQVPIADAELFQRGIPALPPGKVIRTFFDMSFKLLNSSLPTRYDVRVEYLDFRGKRVPPDTYRLDLSLYSDLGTIQRKTVHDVAKYVERIAQNVDRWTKNFDGMHVYVTDQEKSSRRRWRWMRTNEELVAEDTPRGRKRYLQLRNRLLDRIGW